MAKTKSILFRVTEEEFKLIQETASALGLSVSEFLRRLALRSAREASKSALQKDWRSMRDLLRRKAGV